VNVGFIGLGRMGLPMAHNVLRAGFPLTVFNRTQSRASELRDFGAAVAESPADVARASDVLITMLAHGAAVDGVARASDGVLQGARPGLVWIEMSTIGPDAVRALAAEARQRDVALLDAPVSGSVALAENATLSTIVGGDRDTFGRIRPVLAAMTRAQLWLGPTGTGAAMKLALNGIIASTTQAISEALVLAECSGIDRETAYDAIASSAVASPFVEYKRDAFVNPSDAPVAFTLELMQKDLELHLALARRLRVPAPGVMAADLTLTLARASEGDDADLAMVAETLRTIAAEARREVPR
jgi:3-hydroxyisobutyrate dehydrogenase-like beta-hydroxyacid dehydrogenase